jgi:hypothetical protein
MKPVYLITKEGKAILEGLEFPDDFPTGTYKIVVKDKTDPKIAQPIPTMECEFIVYGSGGSDDKKKKKK